ncbi:hypothetical protein PROFUN_02830 [Planoprotostelium fungivorum]|uniref:Uncharacterized protein n=1 Tax=Planoprotostelium fungivorum TaxID=1890364 RepID=A0A2P6NHM1_9EUKA|nr:hypothetical protein PROFUN_09223 [Planoprotostelium fungivorum]PRP88734.1 hypothetical protein PROFUN_02830 [Planoprotostelium fungivorum]
MTKVTEDNQTHAATGQYTDHPDNTASLKKEEPKEDASNLKPQGREGDHHKQNKDKILELEDKIEILKKEAATLASTGKVEAEKEKQREMSAAHDELVALRAL